MEVEVEEFAKLRSGHPDMDHCAGCRFSIRVYSVFEISSGAPQWLVLLKPSELLPVAMQLVGQLKQPGPGINSLVLRH